MEEIALSNESPEFRPTITAIRHQEFEIEQKTIITALYVLTWGFLFSIPHVRIAFIARPFTHCSQHISKILVRIDNPVLLPYLSGALYYPFHTPPY
jgi:hypothetical protein